MSDNMARMHAKTQVLKAVEHLNDVDLAAMREWFSSDEYAKDLNQMKSNQQTHSVLRQLRRTLKEITPFEAEYPSESIVYPEDGDQAENTPDNTVHIDEFIYDEEDVEELVNAGVINRRYCGNCNSRNIKDLTFISHSMSILAIQYIFQVMLPKDLPKMCVLDVGSRVGAVLLGAYYFSDAPSIIGIEKNKDWCDVVVKLMDDYNLDQRRLQVINSDVMRCADKMKLADVVFINVLDFFVNKETQKQMWKFFKDNVKSGAIIVTNRSAEATFRFLGIHNEANGYSKWLKVSKPFNSDNEKYFDLEEFNYGDIHLYTVA